MRPALPSTLRVPCEERLRASTTVVADPRACRMRATQASASAAAALARPATPSARARGCGAASRPALRRRTGGAHLEHLLMLRDDLELPASRLLVHLLHLDAQLGQRVSDVVQDCGAARFINCLVLRLCYTSTQRTCCLGFTASSLCCSAGGRSHITRLLALERLASTGTAQAPCAAARVARAPGAAASSADVWQ